MSLSIVICTKDRYIDIVDAVQSILSQTILPDELIVVDASSQQYKVKKIVEDLLKLMGSKIEFTYIHTKPGLTHQRNIGISKVKGDIIFFFDDDVVLDKEYLKQILRVYENKKAENIGGIQGTFTNVIACSWYSSFFKKIFLLGRNNGNGKISLSGYPMWLWNRIPDKIVKVDFLSGGNMSFKKEVFKNFQFDENFDRYGVMEDVDFSFPVSKKYNLYQTPHARLFHKRSLGDRISSKEINIQRVYHHFLFFRKNIPKTFLHIMAYIWSTAGNFLLFLVRSIARKDVGILSSFFAGELKIVKNLRGETNKT